jgi:hypothetical protein
MQLDKNAVGMLLALDDAQLKFIVERVAVKMGIDTEFFGLKGQDVSVIRKRLAELTVADLAEAQRQAEQKGRKNGN